jgi:hypothetical protein
MATKGSILLTALAYARSTRVLWPLRRSGLAYVASFIVKYAQRHSRDRFTGALPELLEAYTQSGDARETLSRRFDGIMDSLVMPNGVSKTTYSRRQEEILKQILDHDACRLGNPIRVLDVPSSAGTASLSMYAMLLKRYRIASYVLGDMYLDVLYDARRQCVFDDQGRLLQRGFGRHFFSMYRAHISGNQHTWLTRLLLIPHEFLAWYLKRQYPFRESEGNVRIRLIHPQVQILAGEGTMSVERIDVFEEIRGTFDMILSFNLLQRNYFPPERIAMGIQNLARALDEHGLLVIGDTNSFIAYRKIDGELVHILSEGSF